MPKVKQADRKNNKQESIEATLWQSADKLRKNMDAAEYKHVVLGLIFLKYISDAFEVLHSKLVNGKGEYEGAVPEDPNEYTAEKVFFVPPVARWKPISDNAKKTEILLDNGKKVDIGGYVDEAMEAIERQNPSLKGVLPKVYARQNLDRASLGGLIDLVGTIALGTEEAQSKDVLGQVYEYFLGQFALAEGKKGGQFYTPRSVVKLLVEMLEPYEGRVFDPCCGSGGMFVQSEKFITAHQDHYKKKSKGVSLNPADLISIYGQESNQTTWRLAKMNLAIRGIDSSNIKWNNEGSFLNDAHKDLKADFILANPPFNDTDWGGHLLKKDARWAFGLPPEGNANFAWIQHFIYHLSPRGSAGFVMHCGAASNKSQTEINIRRNLITKKLVRCIVALPTQLFTNTTLPVHIWIVSRKAPVRDEILMIDAYDKGVMVESTLRELTINEINTISNTYLVWLNDRGSYRDIVGFCRSVKYGEVLEKQAILAPNRYIEAPKKHRNITFEEDVKERILRLQQVNTSVLSDISNLKVEEKTFMKDFISAYKTKTKREKWVKTEVSDVISTTISGNWGNDEPKKGNIAVKVIRGTDLPNIPLFNLRKTPTRYMSKDKIDEIQLKVDDVVIELSGGSKEQPTGRAAIVTQELLDYFNMPVICSNFCKAIRLRSNVIDPYWFYLYWKKCYDDGLTTRYENQPSGIKNFQLEEFITSELILLPPLEVQAGIIEKLKLMFRIKNQMSYQVNNLTSIIEIAFENEYFDFDR